ncbi:MAG TPA: hypothetical protein VND98_10580 [Solirubrobacterales bacterium]|nr:hypothetical protein [Solirubrobacterales bacterium]
MRRRVILELSAEQLPLLEAAEDRHGTKRAALLAGLEAEAKAAETPTASKAKDENARAKKRAETEAAKEKKACEALKAELASAQKALAKSERELARAMKGAADAGEGWNAERVELIEGLEDRDEEVAELRELVVDQIYCGRCGCWVPAEEWTWEENEEGSYAYHHPCGDHGPSMISASSWLAHREP